MKWTCGYRSTKTRGTTCQKEILPILLRLSSTRPYTRPSVLFHKLFIYCAVYEKQTKSTVVKHDYFLANLCTVTFMFDTTVSFCVIKWHPQKERVQITNAESFHWEQEKSHLSYVSCSQGMGGNEARIRIPAGRAVTLASAYPEQKANQPLHIITKGRLFPNKLLKALFPGLLENMSLLNTCTLLRRTVNGAGRPTKGAVPKSLNHLCSPQWTLSHTITLVWAELFWGVYRTAQFCSFLWMQMF